MNLMQRLINIYLLLILLVNSLTLSPSRAQKLDLPPCPINTIPVFMPDAQKPLWSGCKDKGGLYQGILFQLSGQQEILRFAGIKDSLREGREIRFGATGFLEERNYRKGHLNGKSFILKTQTNLGRLIPKKPTPSDWQKFTFSSPDSLLKEWLNLEPETSLEFTDGRMTRMQFGSKDYHFNVSRDGRIFALNHPELKNLFFVDPEALWDLNAADLKSALLPGFGSCKKYSGPIGRFVRHYDHLLYKREPSEAHHLEILNEIRDRFFNFCVPADLINHLGILECPPQLPSTIPPRHCVLPLSDQIHLPYESKYFTFEFTLGRPPDELREILAAKGLMKLVSRFDFLEDNLSISNAITIQVKHAARGVIFRPLEKDHTGLFKIKKEDSNEVNKRWYEWSHASGY